MVRGGRIFNVLNVLLIMSVSQIDNHYLRSCLVLHVSTFFEFCFFYCRMVVEPRLFALLEQRNKLVLYFECLEARGTHDGRVNYCNCLW